MEKNFSKALLGYNPKGVNKNLNEIKIEFEQISQQYKNKEEELIEENLKLKKDIDEVRNKMKGYQDLRKELVEMLYKSHIEAVTSIYNSEKKLDEMLEYKNEIIKKLEHKNEEINLAINSLIAYVKSIIESNV